jgi:hypothetical protein
MVSSLLQKQQTLLPFQFLLARLSFVKITLFLGTTWRFFKVIFICHISCVTFKPLLTRNLYINFTENDPFLCKPQANLSGILLSVTCIILASRLRHSVSFVPTKALLKDTFRGTVCKNLSYRTTLYRFGYQVLKTWCPNHLSF